MALLLVQVSCGDRPPLALDGGGDGSPAWRDSSGRDVPARADQLTSIDSTAKPALFAALKIETFYADCMPAVPPDPVLLKAHVELLNNGAGAVGPIQLGGGRITATAGGLVAATFEIKPIAPFVIKPGEGLSAQVEKVPGSLKSTVSACTICGGSVRVVLTLGGPGIKAGSQVTSSAVTLSCGY